MKKGPNNLPWELHDPARNVWNCDTAAVPWA